MSLPFEYFRKNFTLHYNLSGIEIDYGNVNSNSISICKNCNDLFWDGLNDIEEDKIVWKIWKGVRIPFLFHNSDREEIYTISNNGKAVINYDIVASTFYFLSGWNEFTNSRKDEFGRISYNESIIKRLNISSIPVVNYYFDILCEAIQIVFKKNIKKEPWGNKNFAVALSHDIDTCRRGWLEGSFSELKKGNYINILKLLFKRIFKNDEWFNFHEIVEIEKKYEATSSFYFLPQKGSVGKLKNADYDIRSGSIQKIMKYLIGQNNEIGVHGSFGSHQNKFLFQKDINKFPPHSVFGNRFHFLMFDPLVTISILEECDIFYDTTLGFAEQIGFRRGICFPFYLYNFEKKAISPIIEIPLIVMDSTLSNDKYMGLSQKDCLPEIYPIVDEVVKFGGVFTLLWHNTFFSEYKYTGWKAIYIGILEYCYAKNGFLTNEKNVYDKIIELQ
jgi:hypothetical protein